MTYFAESRYSGAVATAPGLVANIRGLLLSASALPQLWYERSRQRRALARLDDRLLRDIGIDRASAMEEIAKPFWRG